MKELKKGMTKDELTQFVVFLGMYAKCPENAPEDWFHHGDENINAWFDYINKTSERGYYALDMVSEPYREEGE